MPKNQKIKELEIDKLPTYIFIIIMTSFLYGALFFLHFHKNFTDSIVVFTITAILFGLLFVFLNIFSPHILFTYKTFLTICFISVASVAMFIFVPKQHFSYYSSLLFVSMFLGIIGGNAVGLSWVFMQSSFFFILLPKFENLNFAMEIMASLIPGSIFCIIKCQKIKKRTDLLRYGFFGSLISLVFFFLLVVFKENWNIWAINSEDFKNLADVFGGFLVNGLASAFILTGLLPVIEVAYDLRTDLRLMELADLNHELLKKLSTEAPGTFHHSMNVSRLSESAAEAIGCNPLVARVAAYFHDIGKLSKPDYFKENEFSSSSKHTNLPHSMSKLIIISHVKDGIDLAKQYKLPKWVIDFIPTHHGYSLVEYFYREAIAKTPEDEEIKVTGESFRYPGPKPRTKEEGILMLADSIEAASRILDEYTPAKISGAVHEIIVRKLLDGQLARCALTLGELEKIENTFIGVIAAIYHARIKYPEEKKDKSTKRIYKNAIDEKSTKG